MYAKHTTGNTNTTTTLQRIIHEWYVWFIVRFHGRNTILSVLWTRKLFHFFNIGQNIMPVKCEFVTILYRMIIVCIMMNSCFSPPSAYTLITRLKYECIQEYVLFQNFFMTIAHWPSSKNLGTSGEPNPRPQTGLKLVTYLSFSRKNMC